MTTDNLAFQSIGELGHHLERKSLSCRELVEVFLERTDRLDGQAKAYIEITANSARLAADRIDKSADIDRSKTPLLGIPFASKDLIDVAGVATTAGSRVLEGNIAQSNAYIIDRMFDAGAISLGKLNLHEFAYGATGENSRYGTATNAYDATRLAGGSSSGSASAVAFGLVPAAFGTDTGGSVRAPAALSGLVGLKPTLGRISTRGVIPFAWSLDHVGTLTRTVEDAALLFQAVAGFDPDDPMSVTETVDCEIPTGREDLAGLQVGVPRKFYFEHCDSEIGDACEHVLRFLERRGAAIREVDLPAMDHARTVSLTVQMPEAVSFHSRYLEERGDLYGRDFRAGLALGQCILAEHYVRAKRFMALYRQQTNAVLKDVDVLVTPTTPVIAPRIGTVSVKTDGLEEAAGNAITRFTTFFNMTGHPAITVPAGMHSKGLPMGVQIVGRYFCESDIFKVAAAVTGDNRFSIPVPQLQATEVRTDTRASGQSHNSGGIEPTRDAQANATS